MPDTFTQAIHDYAMKSDDNLIVFVRAGQSFKDFQKWFISSFVKKLEEKLIKQFPTSSGWQIYERSLITEPLRTINNMPPGLSIRSESWQPTLRARIEANDSYKKIAYGVAWNPEHTDEKLKGFIFNTMNQKIYQGFQNKWWPFYIETGRNYFKFCNWSEESTIISMRQVIKGEPPAEILDFFYNELVAIVDALDNCIKNYGD